MDWAEIVIENNLIEEKARNAALIRRTKADGFRLCIDMILKNKGAFDPLALDDYADTIERGENG